MTMLQAFSSYRVPGKRFILSNTTVSVASIIFFFVIWWFIAIYVIDDRVLLPNPLQVFTTAYQLLIGGGDYNLWVNAAASLERVLAGWSLGVVSGVVVGVAMAGNRYLSAALDPILEFCRPIPPLAFAPLLIVWLGIGESSKISILFYSTLPVMVIGTVSAISKVKISWKRAAQTLGATSFYITRRVIIPAALPEIITAMRISSGLAWGSLVAAEIIASSSGLGWMILQASRVLQTEVVLVGIMAIGCLAFITDQILRFLDMKFAPWKVHQ